MRAYRGIFWGKKKYLKQSYFCSSVLKFEQFFCLLTKKSWCQRNNLLLQKKKEENVFTKIVFYSNQFGISSRIVRTLRQKYSQDCQNYIQKVERNNFRTFLWIEEILLKFFGRSAKLLDFWREFFCQLSWNCSLGAGAAELFKVFSGEKTKE